MGARKVRKVSAAEVMGMAEAAIAEARSESPWDAARMGERESSQRIETRSLEILKEWFVAAEEQVRASLAPGGDACRAERSALEMLEGSSWRFVATRDIQTEWGTVVREGGGFTVRALPAGRVSGDQNVVMQGEERTGGGVTGAAAVFTFRLSDASYWEGLGFRRERVWGGEPRGT